MKGKQMLKNYLTAVLFVLAPAIVVIGVGYYFLSWGMSTDPYFGILLLGGIIGFAILRALRIW
jgi:hypothetical protein